MFAIMPLELKWHFLNWDPCKGEQPLQGMELKEKESRLGTSLKAPNGVWSKSPENICLLDGSRINLK